MSIVGTRPPTLDEWNKYELHHRARLAIKPGITGMWQVMVLILVHNMLLKYMLTLLATALHIVIFQIL